MLLHVTQLGSILWEQLDSAATAYRAGAAVAVTAVFTVLARAARGVSPSGAAGGALVSFLLYVSAGPGAFVVLVSVFVLALITTRLGYARKQRLGTAESGDGRTASQVFANLVVGTAAAILFAIRGKTIYLLAFSAALAEAAADTVSSEYGQAHSDRARLITTWELVPAGTDGGITLAGTTAGAVAAFLVSVIAASVRLIPRSSVALSALAGIFGMLLDSVLGAWLERRKFLNNDTVNFVSTMLAAIAALLLGRLSL
ncbi:MAG: hypothetical protein DMG70_16160 [Acidobacteria bacterium]|nr:MAG: hypothetical protein DMG70_16160 [Acidobacteriota bacterium]PYY07456.1 MAG: hypothetical protein DMG69_19355 [Acidobacteriota bacterium]